jgi:hypothetical protein
MEIRRNHVIGRTRSNYSFKLTKASIGYLYVNFKISELILGHGEEVRLASAQSGISYRQEFPQKVFLA